ncbi:PREDICTED: A disintegrin and metalloproteinase with thrombospondin motifs 7-like isoform X2 [Priapulus caudatus]|uniref:A disintegrin and metalloproteinase with thrombospondin motifs 7-like isoform X2 n=1 Tax=Priapulus caudatus TaxID=37621 RepID=A0ABM1EK85_PRICU|nr:PREDICTED: A disintegrin and metalloproteinase with thrombospondin motifs 7-like isoform X2 [Priapulus caudatus]
MQHAGTSSHLGHVFCSPQLQCQRRHRTSCLTHHSPRDRAQFRMTHDDRMHGCTPNLNKSLPYQYLMAPHLESDSVPVLWSNCSRTDITKFLDHDWGSCLDDEPSDHDFEFPVIPPGAMYDIRHQCRLLYGTKDRETSDIDVCMKIEQDVCESLWCSVNDKCMTKLSTAAAEGTQCGDNMWCFAGKCVEIGERPQAVNGDWAEWSEWSACTRTCGGGLSAANRHCANPPPSFGGKYCIGERKRYRICNTESCDVDDPSFHQVQCSAYDSIQHKGVYQQWQAVEMSVNPEDVDANSKACALRCKGRGNSPTVTLNDTMIDGTPCRLGKRDICIDGKCRPVACDWNILSDALEDRCGVCHGDGTSCETVLTYFNLTRGTGYILAHVVPGKARNLRVEEVTGTHNYLAVKDAQGNFLLNGHWSIQWSSTYKMAGVAVRYERALDDRETLTAPGPLMEPLSIYVLYHEVENLTLSFEYTLPIENASIVKRIPEFSWSYSGWTVCSATCGGGIQIQNPQCVEKKSGVVEDHFCNAKVAPSSLERSCNLHQCPAK